MRSIRTKSFNDRYANLPETTKRQANAAYRLFCQNPYHPSLQFKQIDSSDQTIHSVRIGRSWRAIGLLENKTITWIWIGSHAEYDKII